MEPVETVETVVNSRVRRLAEYLEIDPKVAQELYYQSELWNCLRIGIRLVRIKSVLNSKKGLVVKWFCRRESIKNEALKRVLRREIMIFRQCDLVETPWKNGGGITRNIAKEQDKTGTLWRLSMADVDGDGAFSIFPGLTRILTVIQGDGMVLHGPDGDLQAG